MKLWHIWQTVNTGYDTYDSAVVAAETEEDAKRIHPSDWSDVLWHNNEWYWKHSVTGELAKCPGSQYDWVGMKDVQVAYLGEAEEGTEPGVIVSSFNAG